MTHMQRFLKASDNDDKPRLQYRYEIGDAVNTIKNGIVTLGVRELSEWIDVPTYTDSLNVSIGHPRSIPELKTAVKKANLELNAQKEKLNKQREDVITLLNINNKSFFSRVWSAVLNKPAKLNEDYRSKEL